MVQLTDRISIIDKGRSIDGFLKVRARAARSGVYDYLGIEVDPRGTKFKPNDVVKVYRPADEVFDKASLASFVGKPITNDHPTTAVTAANWRDHARGSIFGAVKDGDYVGFDLAFMDADTIAAVDAGKRELSNGYSCDLSIEDGVTPDGVAYQAVQRNIRGNHVALVDQGRAGPDCRVSDSRWAACDALPADLLDRLNSIGDYPMKTMTIDGLKVPNVSDEAEAAINKLQDKVAASAKELADAKAALSAEQGKVTVLEKQIADAKDAASPANLDKRVAERAKLIADAKRILPTIVTDAMTDADVRRAVVMGKIDDAAKDMDDAGIAGAYVALLTGCDDAAPTADKAVQNIAPAQVTDDGAKAATDARDRMIADMQGIKPAAAA